MTGQSLPGRSPSKRTRLLAGVLALGVAGVVADRLFFLSPKAAVAAEAVEEATTVADAQDHGESAFPLPAYDGPPLETIFTEALSRTNTDDLGSDAFMPLFDDAPAQPQTSGTRLECSMAVRDASGGIAVINGKTLRIGEEAFGATLLSVGSGTVTVRYDGREITLVVGKPRTTGTPGSVSDFDSGPSA